MSWIWSAGGRRRTNDMSRVSERRPPHVPTSVVKSKLSKAENFAIQTRRCDLRNFLYIRSHLSVRFSCSRLSLLENPDQILLQGICYFDDPKT
ncbi:40S ribosomal protein S4 [Fusarium oxysporum f. sp. albedinis]|nr:40S ribosomal protein S4 [Fusarium oxysporum f. sp. albedinis]